MKKLTIYLTLLIIVSAGWIPVNAQGVTDTEYFSQTGHNISGDFLSFYKNTPNAELVFGYPITEQFINKDGKTVQYFQRARMELDASQPEGQGVSLTQLGREMYASTGELNVGNAFACRKYDETGFSVCFSFLEYLDANGGVLQFGYPISGFEYHENKIVQYFEKARLEWQPWRADGYRVVISDLGRAYFDKLGEDPALLAPVSPTDNAPRVVTDLHVRAFVWKAVTLANDNQIFYIIVQDQNLQPVPNVSCVTEVNWPNGAKDSTAITSDENGVGIVSLAFYNQPYGSLIYTEITCEYNGLKSSTITSFRIWY